MLVETRAVDFIGYDPRGQAVLLAEANSRPGASGKWASQLRRNILAHGVLPQAPFFLIATPDRIFLWNHDGLGGAETPPDCVVNAREVFAPYFEKLGRPASQVSPEGFEFVVLWWLDDLSGSRLPMAREAPPMPWLTESGLLDSIRNARIEHQAP